MSTTITEQRKAPRVTFISSAIIRYAQNQVMEARVDTRNISLTGLYLETKTRIPMDTPCAITIQLAGATTKLDLDAQGMVCRHDQAGMGFVFTQLNPDSYRHLVNLVKLHAV